MPIAHTWQAGYLFVDPISPPTFLPKARMLHRQNLNVVGIHWTTPQVQTSNIGTAATKTTTVKPRPKRCGDINLCGCGHYHVLLHLYARLFGAADFFVVSKKNVPWGSPSKTNLATVSQRFKRQRQTSVNVVKNMHGCTVCMRLYYLSRAIDCITSVDLCKCWRSTLKANDCALKCSGWWAIWISFFFFLTEGSAGLIKPNSVGQSHAAPKNWCFSPSFHVQSQISDSFDSLKNSTPSRPSRSYHTSRDSAIYTNYPTTVYGIFEEGLGAPSALAFGRPESGITWAPGEAASNESDDGRVFIKGYTVGFSRHGPIFNLQSKPMSTEWNTDKVGGKTCNSRKTK